MKMLQKQVYSSQGHSEDNIDASLLFATSIHFSIIPFTYGFSLNMPKLIFS